MGCETAARPRAGWFFVARSTIATLTVGAIALAGVVMGGTAASAVDGTIAGAVYQDFDDDGTRDAAAGDFGGDAGVRGVRVTATDSTGTVVGTTTTGADGAYSLPASGAATSAVRVDFSVPAGYRSARVGADNGSTVQFVDLRATDVDLGVTQEGMVRTDTDVPLVVVPTQRSRVSTDASQTTTSPTRNIGAQAALLGLPYDSTGTPAAGRTTLARQDQVGTVWGTANYGNDLVFSAASYRRGTEVGPAGLGGIYLTNARSGTPNAGTFVQIPNAGTDPRGNIDPATYDWFHDSAAFDAVGKVGLGDIEISSDQRTLYAVNLNDRSLYAVSLTPGAGPNDAPTAGTPERIEIPFDATDCASDQVRPYGLGEFRGQIHVTLTCTGPTTDDLRAYVVPMNEKTRQFGSPSLDIPLDFTRAAAYAAFGPAGSDPYSPWRSTFAASESKPTWSAGPTPVASSVVFDSAGNMVLSIKDRTSDQSGAALGSTDPADGRVYTNIGAGDLLRACLDDAGSYVLENDGSCGGATSSQRINDYGPGGGKFYETVYPTAGGFNFHGNLALGSALQIPGHSDVMATTLDSARLFSDGVRVLRHSDGSTARSATLTFLGEQAAAGVFTKAGGLGDLSTLASLPPVEIGDRLWYDSDADGIQDAGEDPIAGVTVRLFDTEGKVIATAVTDAQGRYVFSSSPGASTDSAILGLALTPETQYEIRLDNAADYADGGPLDDVVPTQTTQGTDTAVDSNGVRQSPVRVTATVTTPSAGSADHSFDFGFSPALSLGNRLWFDTGDAGDTNNGRFDAGEDPVVDATVELLDGNGAAVLDADGEPITVTTDAAGYYRFDGLAPGDYQVRVAASNFAKGKPLAEWVSSTGASSAFDGASNNADKGIDAGDPAATGITSATIALAPGVTGDADAGATGRGASGPGGDRFDNLTVDFGFVQLYDLTIDKKLTSGDGPYRLGDEVTFSVTPKNNGPATAFSGFLVSDRLPDGLEYVSAEGDDWSAPTVSGQVITLTWQGDDLDAGDSAEPIEVTARVTSTTAGSLRNFTVVVPSPEQRTVETIPVGTKPDLYENGDPTPDDENPSNNDDSVPVTVAAPTLSLGNRLWRDTGAGTAFDNGRFDSGETVVAKALVELLDENGEPVLDGDKKPITAMTDANGYYRFDGLTAGKYIVRVAASNFADDGVLENTLSSTGSGGAFDSASNNSDKGVDSRSPADDGIRSSVIDLQPGVTGDVDTGAADAGANGPFGDRFDNLTADFGFIPGLSLGNRLWFDDGTKAGEANNGVLDSGEKPVTKAVVELLDGDGAPVLDADGDPITTTTDDAGYYRFDGLPAGDYRVRVAASNFADDAPLDGWFSSSPTSTDFASNNSDKGQNTANPAGTGITSGVVTLSRANTLDDGEDGATGAGGHGPNGDAADLLTVDFGFTQALAVGDYVWIDNDGDGQQGTGEPAVENVLVTLLDADGKPVVDLNGVSVPPVRTDARGHYVFDNVPPGTYTVSFSELPNGYAITTPKTGDATSDSNPKSDGVTPPFVVGPAGDHTTDVVDSDGVTIAQRIDRTIDAGIVPLLAVGDYVWIDTDRDGRQDAGETPVAGVTVTLLDADGKPARSADGTPVPPTTTDAAGHYVFDGLRPGDYRVQFSGWPKGYMPTIQSADGSSSAEDSNPDATGLTPVFTLAGSGTDMRPVTAADGTVIALQINPTIDLGLAPQLYGVGDYVWLDSDRDGVQDPGEKPFAGITVTLRNPDGTPARDWQGNPVPPVKTDRNGHYVFDGLPAGDYFVDFTGVPSGFTFTKQGTGGESDSNANASGRTPVFTLGPDAPGMRTVVAADGTVLASFLNPSIDAGLIEIDAPLAATGGALPWILVALSLALLGAGGALLVVRSRRS